MLGAACGLCSLGQLSGGRLASAAPCSGNSWRRGGLRLSPAATALGCCRLCDAIIVLQECKGGTYGTKVQCSTWQAKERACKPACDAVYGVKPSSVSARDSRSNHPRAHVDCSCSMTRDRGTGIMLQPTRHCKLAGKEFYHVGIRALTCRNRVPACSIQVIACQSNPFRLAKRYPHGCTPVPLQRQQLRPSPA